VLRGAQTEPCFTGSAESRPRALSDVDAPELAIITAAQFERVQRQLAKRKPRQMPATRKGQIVSLASGLLYCGACGASYSVRARKRVGERIHT
jgi:hypothetical protein